jgi:N6-adenosine-specific RNA methylase IME4
MWLGDWWRYGVRAYGESEAQAALTGYSLKTCKNAARVADRFSEPSRRRDNLTFSHHDAVAALPEAQADELLDLAETDDLSSRELRQKVRRLRHGETMGVVRGKAADLAEIGKFAVVLADPPWRYEHTEATRAIENNYATMTFEDICELKVPAADDAMLFLWCPAPKLAEGIGVIAAWGFRYRTCLVWVKPSVGPGYYVRCHQELLLVAMRGSIPASAEVDRPDSVMEAPRGNHSEKPTLAHELIERAYPDLSKVEMFVRSGRDGWVAWGDQA